MLITREDFELESIKQSLPEAEYFSTHHLSKSSLTDILKSPLYFWHHHINPETPPKEQSTEMSLGSAFHMAVLEPSSFDNDVVALPKIDKRTKAGKAQYAEFMEEHKGKTILSDLDYNTVRYIRDSIYKHSGAVEYIDDLRQKELSMFYSLRGVPMRSRIDGVGSDFLLDLKTTRDASERGFMAEISKYKYYCQDALYATAYAWANTEALRDFIFLAIEKVPPYSVGIYTLDDDYRRYGWHTLSTALQTYKHCNQFDIWPDYNGNGTALLKAPQWIRDQAEHSRIMEA